MLVQKVVDYLRAQSSIDGTTGWRALQGYVPPDPDQVIVLTQWSGQAAQTRAGLDHPGLQVRVRGPKQDYKAAEAKAMELHALLHARTDVELGPEIRWLTSDHSPMLMGFDENRRPEFVENFSAGLQR